MALAAGTILGQFRVRSPLGAGGMGEVYRAHDTRLDREVAIKVLPGSLTTDPERLRRFEQEARAAAALNHPNILAVHQMATEGGISYLVSELLEGETLRERLAEGPVPLRKAVDYGVQMAHGLAAAHERGVVHRDLKPENLFVTKDGRVKILDFGLAKLTQPRPDAALEATRTQGTEVGVVLGTVGYMAPEQVRGHPADHRADIFALGTILYETVTGRQPFRKPTAPETETAILNEEPPPLAQLAPDVPPGLQRVVYRCLEKNPEQRFQSASDLAFALEALSGSSISMPVPAMVTPDRAKKRRIGWVAAAVLLLAGAVLVYAWVRPPAVPRVTSYVQLTHDGKPKQLGATDGSRLYLEFIGSGFSSQALAELSVSGEESRRLSILPSTSMIPLGSSPDGSELLVADAHGTPPAGPLWGVPIVGGSPRRLGDAEGQDAAWSRDNTMLAFAKQSDLFVAKSDGSDSHRLASVSESDFIMNPVWSPDGSSLRFTSMNRNGSTAAIWEISTDGRNLHPLLPGFHTPQNECCGSWTADGRYFVFLSKNQIWALPGEGGWFASRTRPIQLTSGPMSFSSAIPSRDGKRLFTVGATMRGELVRHDARSKQFLPCLGGVSAEYASFSKDGQWVAYVSYPEGTLWRSKVDGSERLQLTYPPGYAFLPRWSPDGKRLVFFEERSGKSRKIYEVSRDGGTARQLLPADSRQQEDPNWSPDGSTIVFGANVGDPHATIRVLDRKTSRISTLPGSQGLFSPRWSPDGRYLAALRVDSSAVVLFDTTTQKWAELAKGVMSWPNWSHDGKSLYLLEGAGTVIKIRMSDRKTEPVLDLKNFVTAGYYGGALALAPDDSPLLLRDAGIYDVYALDW